MPRAESASELVVDAGLLSSMPLPAFGAAANKAHRGTALIIGGSRETPGGALLAAVAALRVGAGKVQIATVASTATSLGVAVPESLVVGLPETADGAIASEGFERVVALLARADAVLIGTSTLDAMATGALLEVVATQLHPDSTLVVDAGAIPVLQARPELLHGVASRTSVIPNPKEMAVMLSANESWVCEQPGAAIAAGVAHTGTVVALRDAITRTSAPGAGVYVDHAGHAALGTSGSGDVLAGALLGLAAQGTEPLAATLWAVHVHGRSGERLGRGRAGVGTLARELLDELPVVLHELQRVTSRPV